MCNKSITYLLPWTQGETCVAVHVGPVGFHVRDFFGAGSFPLNDVEFLEKW